MSKADLHKWDERYREGSYSERRHPTALLARYLKSLRRGSALDVACGAGRNSLALAGAGFNVDAVDISAVALQRLEGDATAAGHGIRTFEADLEDGIPASLGLRDCYDLIVMVRYVNQPIIPMLADQLAEGGMFICEQHLRTDQDVIGPRNPAYRLEPQQLLESARGLRVQLYFEGIVNDPDGRRAALAQLVASNGGKELLAE